MPKKQGDIKRKIPLSMSEISQKLANDIRKKDARYEYFWNYAPVPKLLEPDGFFRSPKKTCVVFGGNKSTKTTATVFKTVMVYTGIIPPSMRGVYAHEETLRDISPGGKHHRPRRVRIIVMNYTKHWPETIRPLLEGDPDQGAEGMLPEAWSNWDNEERMYTGPDGSYLSIVAINPHEKVDPNVLRGPLIDHTMIDEINQEMSYTESLARGVSLRNGPRSMDLCYCPQEGFECWTYHTFYAPNFNTLTKQPKPLNDRHPNISTTKICMKDNPSIEESERQALIASYKPWEVAYRVDGEYSQRAVNPYFDMETLLKWENEQRCSPGAPFRMVVGEVDEYKGDFYGNLESLQSGEFDERKEAIWHVWELPKDGEKYLLTADIAEGNPDSDPHSVDVWKCTDRNKPLQVAQLRSRCIRPGELGIQAACMSKLYGGSKKFNYALLCPEKNNTGGGMFIERIRNHRNIYKRIRGGKEEEKQTEDLGWFTDSHTKGPMLSDAYHTIMQLAQKDYCPINSQITLNEMMGYEERIERNKQGIGKVVWGARPGGNDDTVITISLAFRVIRHEFQKITTCKNDEKVVQAYHSVLEEQASRSGRRAHTGLRKQKSLKQLRTGWRRGK